MVAGGWIPPLNCGVVVHPSSVNGPSISGSSGNNPVSGFRQCQVASLDIRVELCRNLQSLSWAFFLCNWSVFLKSSENCFFFFCLLGAESLKHKKIHTSQCKESNCQDMCELWSNQPRSALGQTLQICQHEQNVHSVLLDKHDKFVGNFTGWKTTFPS